MRTLVALVLAPAVTLGSAAGNAQERCGTCHADVRTEHAQSIHVEFGCVGCHGGDPAALDAERAHAKAMAYVGTPARGAIPALCASCHADPNRMKAVGLPTDQYAQYQTSGHGKRLAQGDARVAVCTDCHGTHAIRPTREPASPVSRRNVPTTCGRCHSDAALMNAYNLPADQMEKFLGSVHGATLLVEEHPSAPTCSTCHGAHGAVAPHIGSISQVCGHCHVRTREYFRASPHWPASQEGKISECVSCHGHHDVALPTHKLFDTTCPTCHAPGSTALSVAGQLKTLLSRADEAVADATADLEETANIAPTIGRYRTRLQQGRASLMEALPVQHTLTVERVEDLTRTARSISDDVRAAAHGVKQEAQLRYVWLALAWVFIFFTVAVLYLFRKEQEQARAEPPPHAPAE